MSIQHYRMSLQGFSHIQRNIPCQDANNIKNLSNGWVVAAIADGVGSAVHSEIGSKIAVEISINFIEQHIKNVQWNEQVLEALITLSFNEVLLKIQEQSKKDNYPIEDYDTTLSLIIYNGKYVIYGHCGDGGIIVLPKYGDYILLSTIQKGEEFNEVYPLRNKEWNFGHTNEEVVSVLLATDGVFDGLFCSTKKNEEGERALINYNCDLFMNNKKLNPKITDETTAKKIQEDCISLFTGDKLKKITDDKTLLVVINTESEAEDKEYTKPDFTKKEEEQDSWTKAQEENNTKMLKEQTLEKENKEKTEVIENQKNKIKQLEEELKKKEEKIKNQGNIIRQLEGHSNKLKANNKGINERFDEMGLIILSTIVVFIVFIVFLILIIGIIELLDWLSF